MSVENTEQPREKEQQAGRLEESRQPQLQFDKRGGLLPVVVQNVADNRILMLGYVNQEALDTTRSSGYATFYSTSRQALWIKGETSGDRLEIDEILVDCDQDALVYRVRMCGDGVCHTKRRSGKARISCFYRRLDPVDTLNPLAASLEFLADSE